MRRLDLNNFIQFNNKSWGWCHTTHAIIQQIKFIQTSTVIPQDLVPLIVGPPGWQSYLESYEFVKNNNLEDTCIFLIEISSWKYASYQQYYLQHNALVNFETYKDRFNYPQETIDLYYEIKNQVEFGKQDSESVRKGMKLIKNMLPGQVVFFTHCDVPISSSGERLKSRQELMNTIIQSAQYLNCPILNPTVYLKKSQQKYNQSAMNDPNHYTKEFNDFLAHSIYEDVIQSKGF